MDAALPAVYRSQDAIDNLLLRVSVRRRAAPHAAPVDAVVSTYGSSAAPGAPVSEETHHEFAWQEKLFGPAELLALAAAAAARRAGERVTTVDEASPLGKEYLDHVAARIDAEGLDGVLAVPDDGILVYTITDRDARQPVAVRARVARSRARAPRAGAARTHPPLPPTPSPPRRTLRAFT